MAWWREARFGMFIHFGLYAVPAGAWKGHDVSSYSEWIMNKAEIPVAEYAELAKQFDPVRFDADGIACLAKEAGMRYVVITAKHHDGFALFKSAVSSFNSVDAAPCRRDFVRELAEACARRGIRFGVYYSHSQDWHHAGGAGNHWDASQHGDFDRYIDAVAVPQLRELLSNYGPISVLWYDTPRFITAERAARLQAVQLLQPGLIVNNRLQSFGHGGPVPGDTETPEQFIPPNGYPGKDWESCMTMNDNWGFKAGDTNWKSAEILVRNLSDVVSKGGNYLLNIGPKRDGSVPEESIERLRAVGQWLERNGEAVYGTEAGPFQKRLPWGRVSKRVHPDGRTLLYLYVWEAPTGGALLLPGLRTMPCAARLLAGGEAVSAAKTEAGVSVEPSTVALNEPVRVIVLEFDKPLEIDAPTATLDAEGRIVLSPFDADLSGPDDAKPMVVGSGEAAAISNLTHSGEWRIRYLFEVPLANAWKIEAELACGAYNRLTVASMGPHGVAITSAIEAAAENAKSFCVRELGIMRLPAGMQALEIRSEMNDLRPLTIRRLFLSPLLQRTHGSHWS